MLRPPYRRATVFVVGLGFLIQITGINATVTYGPKIFEAMGVASDQQKILMALLVQCFALAAVLVCMRYVDRWGRRPILLTGITIMIFAQLIMVVTFATQTGDSFATWQVVTGFAGLALINIGFVFGFGALVWVYASEAFPARIWVRRQRNAHGRPGSKHNRGPVLPDSHDKNRRRWLVRNLRGASDIRLGVRLQARARDQGS